MIHTVKGFGIVNKAEIDFFMELSCFFDDTAYVGNLISSSSAFSKTSLNIQKFMVHILLKPGLKNFEHYFTSMWDECNCVVQSLKALYKVWGFPGGAGGKESTCQCRRCQRHRFDPWVRKIPWRRAWKPTPVFLPGESHGRSRLAGYSPWSCKESDMTEAT